MARNGDIPKPWVQYSFIFMNLCSYHFKTKLMVPISDEIAALVLSSLKSKTL